MSEAQGQGTRRDGWPCKRASPDWCPPTVFEGCIARTLPIVDDGWVNSELFRFARRYIASAFCAGENSSPFQYLTSSQPPVQGDTPFWDDVPFNTDSVPPHTANLPLPNNDNDTSVRDDAPLNTHSAPSHTANSHLPNHNDNIPFPDIFGAVCGSHFDLLDDSWVELSHTGDGYDDGHDLLYAQPGHCTDGVISGTFLEDQIPCDNDEGDLYTGDLNIDFDGEFSYDSLCPVAECHVISCSVCRKWVMYFGW